MSISIPAIVDTQLTNLKASLLPVTDSTTKTSSSPTPPYVNGNRAADLLRQLTGLIDAGPLTATGGTSASVQDTGAFTGVNSLVGAKVTFGAATTTVALRGKSAYVISNTTGALFFAPGALPGTPVVGDVYTVEFSSIDSDLVVLEGGKASGDSQSNPYSSGPSLINALMKLIVQLGGALPAYLTRVTDGVTKETLFDPAEAFGIGSPHAGAGSYGHGGAILVASAIQLARDTVSLYTKPA
jgi:hypothetical protein